MSKSTFPHLSCVALLVMFGCVNGDKGGAEPDPPTDGLLVLNLRISDFNDGPSAGADDLDVTINSVKVWHRRLVNGELQAPEAILVAAGPAPVSIFHPESDRRVFAGEYWLPPGEVQEIRIDVSNGSIRFADVRYELLFGDDPQHPSSQATLIFPRGDSHPVIELGLVTGFVLSVDAGADGAVTEPSAGEFVLRQHLAGYLSRRPKRFGFDPHQLVVKYREDATPQQIAALEASIGAETFYTHARTGLRFLLIDGANWATTSAKLDLYRSSEIVAFATLDPGLTPESGYGDHDTGIWDDPGYPLDDSAYLADIGVEDAWTGTTWTGGIGSREVIIGFVDDGIDINHPDLVDNLWVNEGELPTVCGHDFTYYFDLDGDGCFTLHDLNHPDSTEARDDAIATLYSCEGIVLSDGDTGEAPPEDDYLYQGSDLLAAFSGDMNGDSDPDDDGNGIDDDLFGANFTGVVADEHDACAAGEATNDVDPDGEGTDGLTKSQHGTLVAGLVGASQGNGANIAGLMGAVRIAEARIDSGCSNQPASESTAETMGALGDVLVAIDYLRDTVGANIIVLEQSSVAEDIADYDAANRKNLTGIFEDDYPDVLFIGGLGYPDTDCDDANYICFPSENDATNYIGVMATGIDPTLSPLSGVMTGRWVELEDCPDVQDAANYGLNTADIAAPGYVYYTVDGGTCNFIAAMPSIRHGHRNNWWGGWEYDDIGYASGSSSAMALVAGVAGLVQSYCPEKVADGTDLADLVLGGADTSPPYQFGSRRRALP